MILLPFRPLVLVLALLTAGGAHAAIMPEPAIRAVAAASKGDDVTAYDLAGEDRVTSDLITWLRLRGGGGDFADYVRFANARPDWPEQDRLRALAETAIVKGTPAPTVLDWFGDAAPQTGQGAVRLAEALIQTGELDRAKAMLTKSWVDLRLNEAGETAMLDAFGDILAPVHQARTEALLWRSRAAEAARMLPLLSEDQAKVVQARLALIRRNGREEAALRDVPAALRDQPGLDYDLFNWLADKGRQTDAAALLLARSTSAEALGEPFRWSGWRRILARWQMREGHAEAAYRLASQHFMGTQDGENYADLEWLAGYLQLTYLDDPTRALTHFDAARAAVDSPISVSRMEYWRGRVFEAQDDPRAAEAYAAAAVHQTAFYGLLASEKIGKPLDPALTGQDDPVDWQGSALLDDDLVRAGVTLLEAGERAAAVPFFVALGASLSPNDIARLGALVATLDEPYFEVLLGKTAVANGVLVPSVYFPLHDLAQMDLPVSPALALSIARRESEFNAGVGSPVGALGLMQLMPATAEEVAGQLGLPYSRARLTADWAYNARLGSAYLAALEARFGPSVVQVAAGYNAGPSRSDIWMDQRGDPRLGTVDVVDWIEHIPFRETRNYVMRVSESIPVYEARLSGKAGPVRFTRLLVGQKPLIRPRLRPVPVDDAVTTETAAPAALASEAAVVTSQRPVARPGG